MHFKLAGSKTCRKKSDENEIHQKHLPKAAMLDICILIR
jgi:hypothetical protein